MLAAFVFVAALRAMALNWRNKKAKGERGIALCSGREYGYSSRPTAPILAGSRPGCSG
jgi:hypothetical protein